jgi:hypothetical protein
VEKPARPADGPVVLSLGMITTESRPLEPVARAAAG